MCWGASIRGAAGALVAALALTLLLAASPAGARTMLVQPDGKIVVAGSTPHYRGYVARLEPDGSPDPSFGIGGVVAAEAPMVGLARQPDGRLLALAEFGVTRYLPDGGIDASFGEGGLARLHSIWARDLLLLPDGRIAVGGNQPRKLFPTEALIEVLSADGRQRELTTGAGLGTGMNAMAPGGEGSILIVGGGEERTYGMALVARFVPGAFPDYGENFSTLSLPHPELGYDRGFAGGAGLDFLAFPGPKPGGFWAGGIVVGGGGIFVAGGVRDRVAVARLGADGVLDRGFGDRGFGSLSTGRNTRAAARDLALTADGRILVAGDFGPAKGRYCTTCPAPLLVRLLPGGAPDRSFGSDGIASPPNVSGPRHGALGENLALLPDGRIVLSGLSGGHEAQMVLARFHPNGGVDRRFGRDGVVRFEPCGGSEAAQRANGCLPTAQVRLERRGGGFRFEVAPRDWGVIETLRLRLPPDLELRPTRSAAAKVTFRDRSGERHRMPMEKAGGERTLFFDSPQMMNEAVIELRAAALRPVPGAVRSPRPPFRLDIGFRDEYRSAGEQTLTVR